MSDLENRIKQLAAQINSLQNRQKGINNELQILQNELDDLKNFIGNKQTGNTTQSFVNTGKTGDQSAGSVLENKQKKTPSSITISGKSFIPGHKLEDFIGTNITSKVGILITIIGIFIGAKYAVDKDLISPAMRILVGYLAGAGLIITSLKLKPKYENFSAVLMGGGLAVFYFLTYIAYGFYQMFPQAISFLLMVTITATAVFIATWYNQKIIAVLGQVGAYAVPFLLSDGSGNVLILLTYISIINAGLLILSFRKDWKVLYRIAFFLTWLIYASWLIFKERTHVQAEVGFIFLCINFLTFYVTFLSYKVVKKELYSVGEITIMLINALAFFFAGIYLADEVFSNTHTLTYFTIANAVIHFAIGLSIHRLKLADNSVFQFIIGLGFLFITIAIPVELNGSWVTLLWAMEACILSWVAFKNNRQLYVAITLPMVAIAVISLLQDWYMAYPHLNELAFEVSENIQPFGNITFSFSLIVSACFGIISYVSFKNKADIKSSLVSFFRMTMPVLFGVILYLTLYNEIHFTWDTVMNFNDVDYDDKNLRNLTLLMFSFIYIAIFLECIRRYGKSKTDSLLLFAAAILCATFFLVDGLNAIGDLRDNYIANKSQHLSPSIWLLGIRYLCCASLAIIIISCRRALIIFSNQKISKQIFSSLFNIVLLSVICNEFIHWMDLAGYQNQYKLGLSIICALYALVLVFIGIRTKKKYLRIGAIFLFGLTLIKLFFYDLVTLSTISKTIVLIILGVILLVISFLYNKYKSIIIGED